MPLTPPPSLGGLIPDSIPEEIMQNKVNNRSNPLLRLPNEMIGEIASHFDDQQDIFNFRLTSMMLTEVEAPWFFRLLTKGRTIYSKYACMAHFLGMLRAFSAYHLGSRVTGLSLVSEGLRMHEYGPDWAWEEMSLRDDVDITMNDQQIISKINSDHADEVYVNGAFITGGGYRSMLGMIIAACPNLEVINIRKIKADEHIPGWTDTGLFKQLSFYRPGLYTKSIFYGDWLYDTHHFRVTQYCDEFGDTITEPNAGPQANFKDDLEAAVKMSVKAVKLNFVD